MRAGLSMPTRLHTEPDSLGEACTPLSPLPDLRASSFAQRLLFVSQRLSGPLRPCPSSGLLSPVLMTDSDFQPEEALRPLLLSCLPDVNRLPPPLFSPTGALTWVSFPSSTFLHLEPGWLPQVRALVLINKPSCQTWQPFACDRKQEGLSISRGLSVSTAPIWVCFILQASRVSTSHYFLSFCAAACYQDLLFP